MVELWGRIKGIDGTQAAEQILNKIDIPIVFLSSHTEKEIVEKTENITSYGYVVKNSGIIVLDASIKMALKLFESRQKEKDIEQRNKNLIEQSPIIYELYDENGFQIDVNPAWEKLWGIPKEYCIGKYNILNSTVIIENGLLPIIKKIYNGETVYIPETFYPASKDNETKGQGLDKWISTVAYPLKNKFGNVTNIVVLHEDITERKVIENLLYENEERYRKIFETAPIAIIFTRGTEILYANSSYLEMFGLEKFEELKQLSPVELFTPEWRPKIIENIKKRAEGLPVPTSYQAECLKKDGTIFPVYMHFTRANFSDGPATVGFIIDMTSYNKHNE